MLRSMSWKVQLILPMSWVWARLRRMMPTLPSHVFSIAIYVESMRFCSRAAALAAEGKKVRAALVGTEQETIVELLMRLDAALDRFSETGVVTDEVLPEIQRRQKTP